MTETPAEIIDAFLKEHDSTDQAFFCNARGKDIIAALAAKGYKIMPREPTVAMLKAGYEPLSTIGVYRAMWDAAAPSCNHDGYQFKLHGRCCPKCRTFMMDWGD